MTAAPPLAHTAPGDGAAAVSPTLPLAELGSAVPLELYGQTGTVTLTVPVPPGLRPAALNVVVERPVFVRTAVLTVVQNRRTRCQCGVAGAPRFVHAGAGEHRGAADRAGW